MSKKIDFQKLFEEKKYTKILSIIQNIEEKNLNAGLINLSGVCKILSDKSEITLKSAIIDFRTAYLKDKKKNEHSFNALKNFINGYTSQSLLIVFFLAFTIIHECRSSYSPRYGAIPN